MIKHKLMTHTDLDGVGCAIVMKHYDEDVEVEFCSNQSIYRKLELFLEDEHLEKYSKLTITDLPIKEETAKRLDEIEHLEVILIDHHETQKAFNVYDWATIQVEKDGHLYCATELLYKSLVDQTRQRQSPCLERFVECVRLYDTWGWEKANDQVPKDLNSLLGFQGLERFLDKMMVKIAQGIFFTKEEEELLHLLEENRKKYIKRKYKRIERLHVNGYEVGIVFGEQYISELGHALAEEYKDLDLIAIFTGERISFRTIKPEINLGEWSKLHYDGGGHQGAAGMQVSEEKKLAICKLLLE